MASFKKGFVNGTETPREELIGRIEDIKSAPRMGEQRLLVRDKATRKSRLVDMPTSEVAKLKRKETYSFNVEERNTADRDGIGGKRVSNKGFVSYYSDETPELSDGEMEDRWSRKDAGGGNSRFNGSSKSKYF